MWCNNLGRGVIGLGNDLDKKQPKENGEEESVSLSLPSIMAVNQIGLFCLYFVGSGTWNSDVVIPCTIT